MFIKISQLKKSYDSVIIGGGLSATLAAVILQRHGQKTLLIDPQEQGTATTRHLGLEMVPKVAGFENDLQFLQEILLEPIQTIESEQTPITYEAGFKPFVGFGDQTPEFVDEIEYYTKSPHLTFDKNLDDILDKLTESYQGDHLTGYQPRRFEIEEGQLKSVVINNHNISANSIVYCDLPTKLKTLIEEDILKKKTMKDLGRLRLWTSISLDLEHKEESQELFQENTDTLHVLMGNKDKSDPCWGRFFQKGDTLHSQWMSLISAEQTADAEYLGSVLKKIQKQLKRAYPEFEGSIEKERILVHYGSHGSHELQLSGHQTLPEIENLWIASQWSHKQRNLIGLLQQVRLVLSAMGFSTENLVSPQTEESIATETSDTL